MLSSAAKSILEIHFLEIPKKCGKSYKFSNFKFYRMHESKRLSLAFVFRRRYNQRVDAYYGR